MRRRESPVNRWMPCPRWSCATSQVGDWLPLVDPGDYNPDHGLSRADWRQQKAWAI